jgi:2-methylcitrate dehydratase PrpD
VTDTSTVLAEFAVKGSWSGERMRHDARRALADTVGVALAASHSRGLAMLREWQNAQGGIGNSTLWCDSARTNPSSAALVNGTAAHLLDYDDVAIASRTHPSAVILPALMAVAEDRQIPEDRVLDAYTAGAAAIRALTVIMPRDAHYARGWHTTATLGRLAAVCALAALVETPIAATRHALGIVASLAAGSQANFGTMTKPLHAGAAARDAVTAIELAERGFTANVAALDDPQRGFVAMYGGDTRADPAQLAEALHHWANAWPSDVTIKLFPSCFGTHRAIDAALRLRAAENARDLESVQVEVHPQGLAPLRPGTPTTGDEARFSLAYTVAVALLDGRVTFASFTDESVQRPDIRDMAPRIEVAEAPAPSHGSPDWTDGFAVVTLRRSDGSTVVARTDAAPGQRAARLSDARLAEKVLDCCRHGGISRPAQEVLADLCGAGQSRGEGGPLPRAAPMPADLRRNSAHD